MTLSRDDLAQRQQAIRQRLAEMRWRIRRHLLSAGLARTALAVTCLAALSLLGDWQFRFTLPVRLLLGFLAAGVTVGLIVRYLIRPMRLPLADMDLAVMLDVRAPGVARQVEVILQLPMLLDQPGVASPSLIRAAVAEELQRFEAADWDRPLHRQRELRWRLALLGLGLIWLTFRLAAPGVASLWARRWLLAANARWPQRTYLAVEGLDDSGRLAAPRGEPFMLRVHTAPRFAPGPRGEQLVGRGTPTRKVDLTGPVAPSAPENVRLTYTLEAGPTLGGLFEKLTPHQFRFELPPVQVPTQVTVRADDDQLGPFIIMPIDRPTLAELSLMAHSPGQTDPEKHPLLGAEAQLLFLPDTALELRWTASEALRDVVLTAATGAAPAPRQLSDTAGAARWKMKEPQTLQLQLTSLATGLTSRPYAFSLGLLKDREPRVTIRSTGVGRRITPRARVPVFMQALDDFGIVKLDWDLEFSLTRDNKPERRAKTLPIPNPPGAEPPPGPQGLGLDVQRQAELPMGEYGLPAGAAVRIRALAADNCFQGKQVGASRWLAFQIVSPDELFYEILMRQRQERGKFKAAVDAAKTQLEVLGQKLDAEKTAGLVRRHQVIARQTAQVAGRLEATLLELTLNDLGTEPARRLLESGIIQPLRELAAAPFSRQLRTLDRLAADADSDPNLPVVAKQQQAELVKTMQRILDQMAQWESFVDVVNQLREVMRLQASVQEATEKARKERVKSVFDE